MGEGKKTSWVWKLFWIIIILALLVGLIVVAWKLFAPAVFQAVFGERWVELEKRQEELQRNLTETQARVDELEKQVDPNAKKPIWPIILIIVLAVAACLLIYFLRDLRGGFDGKTKEQMEKIAYEYLTQKKHLDIKSFFSMMFRPVGADQTSWFVFQGNFDAYKPGLDMPSHKCFTIATNNRFELYVWDDFPNKTMDQVMTILENRHFGRGKQGLPHFKPVKEEPFEGLRLAESKAALQRIEDAAKENVEE